MTKQKINTTEVEDIVKPAGNSGRIYSPKSWVGRKVRKLLLTALIVLALATLLTSQTVVIVIAKKQQPKQAVDTPSAGWCLTVMTL